MSHFCVYVVTDHEPSEQELSRILQPWHEFECTGVDDEYVQTIDDTDEMREYFEKYSDEGQIFAEFLEDEGRKRLDGEPGNEHKYGFYREIDGEIRSFDRTNPNKKWDWWVVGGRWSNYLLNRSGENTSCVEVSDIDFDAVTERDVQRDTKTWHMVRALCGDPTGMLPWSHFLDSMEIDEARAAYGRQPWLVEFRKHRDLPFDAEPWLRGLSEVVEDARRKAGMPFAIVLDGEWIQKGKMGWWGIVRDEDDTWYSKAREIITGLPVTSWITVVDCHI